MTLASQGEPESPARQGKLPAGALLRVSVMTFGDVWMNYSASASEKT
jgi:hypothetical protein